MRHHDADRVHLHGLPKDLDRADVDGVDRADKNDAGRDHLVADVEAEDAQLLLRLELHFGLHDPRRVVGGRDHGLGLFARRCGDALAQFEGGEELRGFGLAEPVKPAQLAVRNPGEPLQPAGLRKEARRESDDALRLRPRAEEYRQQLRVAERARPGVAQAFAGALAARHIAYQGGAGAGLAQDPLAAAAGNGVDLGHSAIIASEAPTAQAPNVARPAPPQRPVGSRLRGNDGLLEGEERRSAPTGFPPTRAGR